MARLWTLGDLTSASEDLRKLRSRFQNPTNAQAVAALDGLTPQPDADTAIAQGMREDVARAFLGPAGVLPRMRLLAWGWTKQGDRFKAPGDAAWWRARYQYPLWNPLETFIDQAERGGVWTPELRWDDDLASGSAALLSYALPTVIQSDLPPVVEAPCPRWLIPPGRGQLPIPNPECLKRDAKKPVEDIIDKLRPGPFPWWLVIVIGYLVLDDRR